jgi:pilus assembly protein Flp/PilA
VSRGGPSRIEPDANSVTKHNRVASGSISPSSGTTPDRSDAGMEIAQTFLNKGYVMDKFVKSFVMDESGASAAEYALILAVIGSVIAIAAIGLAGAIGGAMDDAKTCISDPSSANC